MKCLSEQYLLPIYSRDMFELTYSRRLLKVDACLVSADSPVWVTYYFNSDAHCKKLQRIEHIFLICYNDLTDQVMLILEYLSYRHNFKTCAALIGSVKLRCYFNDIQKQMQSACTVKIFELIFSEEWVKANATRESQKLLMTLLVSKITGFV